MLNKVVSVLLITALLFGTITPVAFATMDKPTKLPVVLNDNIEKRRDISAEDFFGEGWRLISKPKSVVRNWRDLTRKEQAMQSIVKFIISNLGLSAYLAEEVKHDLTGIDYESYGGTFVKVYHIARPVRENLQKAKIPVACECKWVTIVYSSRSLSITDYAECSEISDQPIRLVNWHKLRKIDGYWQ